MMRALPDGHRRTSSQRFVQGLHPRGERLEEPMPWEAFALLSDEELESIYLYLESVEPLPQRG